MAIARPFSDRRDSRMQLLLRERFPNARIVIVEHHRAHAASAYFASPFEEATVLSLDRSGDFRCGARWQAHGCAIDLDTEIFFPDSIGDLYTRVTELLGFRPRSEEHKVQWLSAFAPDDLASVFRRMMLREATGFRLDRDLLRPGPPRQGRLQRPFLRGDRPRRGFEHRRRLARAHRRRPAVGRRSN